MGGCASVNVGDHHGARPAAYAAGADRAAGSALAARTVGVVAGVTLDTVPCLHGEGLADVVCGTVGDGTVWTMVGGEDRRLVGMDVARKAVTFAWGNAHTSAVTRLCVVPRVHGSSGAGGSNDVDEDGVPAAASLTQPPWLLASASRDRTVKLWTPAAVPPATAPSLTEVAEAPTPLATLTGHDLAVTAVCATRSGARLGTGCRDTAVRVWDVATARQLFRGHRPQNVVTCMSWWAGAAGGGGAGGSEGEDEHMLVQGGEDLRVRIWDVRAGVREVSVLEGYVYFPLTLDISPCGAYLLTGSKGFNAVGCEARLWDLRGGGSSSAAGGGGKATPSLLRQYTGHVQDVVGCAFLPGRLTPTDGSDPCAAFVTASKDGALMVWNQDTGAVLSEFHEPSYGSWTSLTLTRHPHPAPPSREGAASTSARHLAHVAGPDMGGTGSAGGDGAVPRGGATVVATSYAGATAWFHVSSTGKLTLVAQSQPTPTPDGEGVA